jgi:hypothetical protein
MFRLDLLANNTVFIKFTNPKNDMSQAALGALPSGNTNANIQTKVDTQSTCREKIKKRRKAGNQGFARSSIVPNI